MKFKGQSTSKNYHIVVIPRPDHDIVFKADAVLDYSQFDTLLPSPVPKTVIKPGGLVVEDPSDNYSVRAAAYLQAKYNFMILKSLEGSDGIEWEKAVIGNPETWDSWQEELKESGFTNTEINMIVEGVQIANGINADHIEKARQSFLVSQQVAKHLARLSLTGEQLTT